MLTALRDIPAPSNPITKFNEEISKGKISAFGTNLESPVPYFPLAMSGNGCCALIVVGPLARVYDLITKKLIAERKLHDYFNSLPYDPVGSHFPGDALLSRDGRTFAVTVTTWEGFSNFISQKRKEAGQTPLGHTYPGRSIQIFSVDREEPVGSLPQSICTCPSPRRKKAFRVLGGKEQLGIAGYSLSLPSSAVERFH